MELRIPMHSQAYADRDGTGNGHGREGFDIMIDGFKIHFEDEQDAVNMAKAICVRMGIPCDVHASCCLELPETLSFTITEVDVYCNAVGPASTEKLGTERYITYYSRDEQQWFTCQAINLDGEPNAHTGRLDDEIQMAKVHCNHGCHAQVRNTAGVVVWSGKPCARLEAL